MKKLLVISASALLLLSCGQNTKPMTFEAPQPTPAQNTVSNIQVEKKVETDPLVGIYKCDRTKDTYIFYSDKMGEFSIKGSTSPSSFTWTRVGDDVTILYKHFGEQKLKFNQVDKTITEKSASLGILVFRKIG